MQASRYVAHSALKIVASPYLWCGLIALALTQPGIILILSLLALPLIAWLGMTYWLLIAPALVLLGLLLIKLRIMKSWPGARLLHSWACCLLLCAGWAAGTSRMGDIASSMGARNMPFLDAFLLPDLTLPTLIGMPP